VTHSLIGVDEVGRGAWAGPLLVIAARQLSDLPAGLSDSKLMTKKQREKILDLLSISCQFGEGWVMPSEIDQHGLAEALRKGVHRALRALLILPIEEIIMDGSVNYAPKEYLYSKNLVKADISVPIVSAASVYAKLKRDEYMYHLAKKHPSYGFDKHVGYGTALHRSAIKAHGVLRDIHRLSFSPVAQLSGAKE
jgi:ribonuclease HII